MTEVTCSNCFTQTNVEEGAKYPVIPSSWVRLRMDFDRGILTDTVICGDCVKVVREALAERKEGFVKSSVAETDAAYVQHEAEVDAAKEAEAQAELERQADEARFAAQNASEETVPDELQVAEDAAAQLSPEGLQEAAEEAQELNEEEVHDSAPIPADRDTALDAAPVQVDGPAEPRQNYSKKSTNNNRRRTTS